MSCVSSSVSCCCKFSLWAGDCTIVVELTDVTFARQTARVDTASVLFGNETFEPVGDPERIAVTDTGADFVADVLIYRFAGMTTGSGIICHP